jgi:hypothetical protein
MVSAIILASLISQYSPGMVCPCPPGVSCPSRVPMPPRVPGFVPALLSPEVGVVPAASHRPSPLAAVPPAAAAGRPVAHSAMQITTQAASGYVGYAAPGAYQVPPKAAYWGAYGAQYQYPQQYRYIQPSMQYVPACAGGPGSACGASSGWAMPSRGVRGRLFGR